MTKIQLLATLLALIIFGLFVACNNDDSPEPDKYKVTPDLRVRINNGMKLTAKKEKNLFNEKFTIFRAKCDEMAHISNPYTYMETEEYNDFREFVLSASPSIYYLLMDKYLKDPLGFFPYIMNDILITAYPETADQIAERLNSSVTVQESMDLYPQVCVDIWLDILDSL